MSVRYVEENASNLFIKSFASRQSRKWRERRFVVLPTTGLKRVEWMIQCVHSAKSGCFDFLMMK